MKKITFFTAIAMIAFTSNAVAQATASGTASSATVIAPIGITNSATLLFGNLALTGAGTVVLYSDGTARANTGGVTATSAGTNNPAAFDVTGEASFAYTVTLPGDTDVTLSDGATTSPSTMTVTGFESSHTANGAIQTGGTDSFKVGATLNVGASQIAATYNGTFDVTVAYD
jgi:hypothetical protein